MKPRTIVLIIGLLVALPLLAIGGLIGYLTISGTPFPDEWQCSDGEAPYATPDGGRACAVVGSDLPPEAEWEPLGNRPLSCHDRWGWTEVERIDAPEEGTDCAEEGRPLPDGWRPVD